MISGKKMAYVKTPLAGTTTHNIIYLKTPLLGVIEKPVMERLKTFPKDGDAESFLQITVRFGLLGHKPSGSVGGYRLIPVKFWFEFCSM